MELSKRLQAIANMVEAGSKLADIGTDHAYLPIYLVEQGMVSQAFAMDVNEGPLRRARTHVAAHGLLDSITLRLSDGLQALTPGEATTLLLAGMGGGLMMRILTDGWQVVEQAKDCILQPQSEVKKFRAFLLEKGFFFLEEQMVYEDGKYYPMMRVSLHPQNEGQEQQTWTGIEQTYGRGLLQQRHPVLHQYLQAQLLQTNKLIAALQAQQGERASIRRQELQSELQEIKEALQYWEEETYAV
jgi:tRNA (adenine22-N1)-methyltransferase